MRFKNPFAKPELDFEFIDVSRSIYQKIPVVPAKTVTPSGKAKQIAASGAFKFAHCPGILDYSQLGYIIPAWTDMKIFANSAGVVAEIGSEHRGTRGFMRPITMDSAIVEGFLAPSDGVPLTVLKFECPWYIRAAKNVSALTLPAWYHADWVDDLHCWPGTVDYTNFSVTNFIVSPKRKCIVHIKAGDPLLHIIPFYGKDMLAGYGPGSDAQVDKTKNEVWGDQPQFYRRMLAVKKVFGLVKK
jgi:hypothetical protein